MAFPTGLKRRYVNDDTAAGIGAFTKADHQDIFGNAKILNGATKRKAVGWDNANIVVYIDKTVLIEIFRVDDRRIDIGKDFEMVRTANITPDMDTGIGNLSRDNFIGRFKAFDNEEARNIDMPSDIVNTTMPWLFYSGMTEDDLGAIYDYLRTVEPLSNRVEKYTYVPE